MWLRRLRYWLNAARGAEDLRAEMELHLEEAAADLRDKGLTDAEALAQATRRFGNLTRRQEDSREVWIALYLSDFLQDLRYGARNLRRSPGFAAVAILSSALGIGACSTVFTIVNFALFRPLPVADPERLLSITAMKQKGVPGGSLSYPELRDLNESARTMTAVAAYTPFLPAAIHASDAAGREWGYLVTGNYFNVVQPRFAAGRGFVAGEDDVPGAPAKIVLAHTIWSSRFRSDPGIVGRTISVNKRPMTVVGVTGAGFRGTEVGIPADFFLPISQVSEMDIVKANPERLQRYDSQWLFGLARLRPDATTEHARTELQRTAVTLRERVRGLTRDRSYHAERAGQLLPYFRSMAIPAFLLLLSITMLVLITACANIANLMLARASARRQEIATRLAIGAGRGRLIRQLLTESLLLASFGGIAGLALAWWAGIHIAGFRLPIPLPIDLTLSIDYRVVLFSAMLSVLTGVTFGLVPAFRATRPDLIAATRGDGINTAGLRRFGLRNILVVAQVGISAVLVICSGLFLRSLGAARAVDSGMQTKNVLLARFDPALSRYDQQQTQLLLLNVLREAEAMAGVRAASVTNLLPLSLGSNTTIVGIEGRPANDAGERTAVMAVGPGYFDAIGIRITNGSAFGAAPSSEPVAIVNQELARCLYPNGDALGRYIIDDRQRTRIIGIASNSKYRMIQESKLTPILYKPILDSYATEGAFGGITLMIRTEPNAGPSGDAIRQLLLRHDPELVVNLAGTMETHLEQSMILPRLAASLFGLCGGIGLLIASIGVYGVVSFAIARRRREIGIRMALGARASQVVGMVLWHGTVLAGIGVAAGAVGGLVLARAAGSLIYGVSATDPVTFLTAPLLLIAVALLATAIPARRAAAVDPNQILRAD